MTAKESVRGYQCLACPWNISAKADDSHANGPLYKVDKCAFTENCSQAYLFKHMPCEPIGTRIAGHLIIICAMLSKHGWFLFWPRVLATLTDF